jgi:ABC-type amino acid transport substrate-binding protein
MIEGAGKGLAKRRTLCAFLLSAWVSGSTLALAQEIKTMRVGFLKRYLPYSFEAENGKLQGFDVDVLQSLASILNVTLKIQVDSMANLQKKINSGDIAVIANQLLMTPENRRQFDFVRAYAANQLVCVQHEDDVRNFTLGDTIGTLTSVGKMYPTSGSANDNLILQSNSNLLGPGNFPATGSGYAGFLLGGPVSFNYGWAQFELLTVGQDTTVTFVDYAWQNTANASIEVGAVPEPSTYALLGIALAGLAAHVLRRRRAA